MDAWNTSTLCQIYWRTWPHYWAALQGQKPCVVHSPKHWLLYHPGANESATSSGLPLELPVCESWARGCAVLTRTLVILKHLCLRDTGRCVSFLYLLVARMWSQALFHTPSLASLKTSLCGTRSPILWSQKVLFEKWSVSSDLLRSEELVWVNTGL